MFCGYIVEHMKNEIVKVRDIPPVGIRMPKDLREQLEREARANGRSLNMEIVGRLRRSLEASGEATQYTARDAGNGAYQADITDIERQLLAVFRRMPPEKQLALLSLFN